MNAVITGFGKSLPPNVIDNKLIVSMMDTSEEFIESRTGVKTRRFVSEDFSTSKLMINSCKYAIEKAGLIPYDIDLLIVNTLSPDYHDPSQACLIQPLLKLRNTIPVFDIRAQCSGLIYAMTIAEQFISTGKYKNILISCGEVLSKRMDTSNEGRNLSILLGDGAGAIVLSAKEGKEKGIIDSTIHADGTYFELLWTEKPGTVGKNFLAESQSQNYFRMNGKIMFRHAIEKFSEVIIQTLERNNLTLNDIDVIIPHQPNMRILEGIIDKLNVPREKIIINVDKYGNMASGSLPVTLSDFLESTSVEERDGKLALIVGYGSGATWGSILYKF